MQNPIPHLRDHCNLRVSAVSQFFPTGTPLEVVHRLFRHGQPLDPKLHAQLRDLTLVEWGASEDRTVRNLLWNCYFPDTRPHIYHMLVYEHYQLREIERLTKYSERVIDRILAQPRLHQRQLRRVGRFASHYAETISKKKYGCEVDPRYMSLRRALHDPKRLYMKGEIIAD